MRRRKNGVGRLVLALLLGGLALAGVLLLLGRPGPALTVLVLDPVTPP